ncbi:Pecanex-Like Protein 1 [Manis pentadactyla]|nr:Pecanex-Like Protein 1 [Manis pentadactyla]
MEKHVGDANGCCEGQVQESRLAVKYLVHGSGLGLGFQVFYKEYRSHEHHEELSSGSDVMGIARWWIRAIVSHEHHEELSSGSDVMGIARWWIRAIVSVSCKGKAMRMIRLRRELGVNSDVMAKGDCAIQFQDYSEARVISILMGNGQIELQLYGSSCETFKLLVSVQETLAHCEGLGTVSDVKERKMVN